MRTRTAAIRDGVVVDIEVYDDTNMPAARPDGLQRMPCQEEWVEVGFRHNGTEYRMPDGSNIRQSYINDFSDRHDDSTLSDRILDLKEIIPDLKARTGSNDARIRRLEDAMITLIRKALRDTK